jgi:hypothetical protein
VKKFRKAGYAFTALATVFIAGTKGFTSATRHDLGWFELLILSLTMAVNLTNTLLAFFDKDAASEKIQ